MAADHVAGRHVRHGGGALLDGRVQPTQAPRPADASWRSEPAHSRLAVAGRRTSPAMTATLLRVALLEASMDWAAPVSTYGLMQALRGGRPVLVLTDADGDDGVLEPVVVDGPDGD